MIFAMPAVVPRDSCQQWLSLTLVPTGVSWLCPGEKDGNNCLPFGNMANDSIWGGCRGLTTRGSLKPLAPVAQVHQRQISPPHRDVFRRWADMLAVARSARSTKIVRAPS